MFMPPGSMTPVMPQRLKRRMIAAVHSTCVAKSGARPP
jgi:hypothetical protein